MASEPQKNLNGVESVPLSGRVEVFPTMPLPDLDAAGGKAYAARFRTEASADLFAIICLSSLLPRPEDLNTLRGLDNPHIIRFVESGVVDWPDGGRAYAIVYQRPLAPRMMTDIDETRTPLSEDAINHHFIMPMIDALATLSASGIVHNGIRPNNIFWRIGNAAPPQIGECLSAPGGVGQPVLFEPIERALATPMGRGRGTHADDCYAFGVTLALLVLGKNPMQGMNDAEIIDAKMQRGSFGTLVGAQRLSPTHIEILRGLLVDDARQRWTAANLEQWLSGRRMTPKNSDAGRRGARHLEFEGKNYWQTAPLACALAANVSEAAKLIENDGLDKWLRRALNDEERANQIKGILDELKQSGKSAHYEEQLVARVCIALDSAAPIRYRGLAVMPAGLAPLLAEGAAAGSGGNIPVLCEIIASRLAGLWIEAQREIGPEQIALLQLFDRMKGVLEKTSFGSGVERVVYELDTGAPCLSPMLKGQYVMSPKTLLPALERVAASGNRPSEPIDRHIAAFMLSREKRGEAMFAALGGPDGSSRRGVALLSLFSELQYRHGPERLPHLAGWLVPFIEPALRRFLGKSLRDRLHKQVKEAVADGSLPTLLRLIDDPRRIERDRQEFIAARLLHLNTQKEIVGLEAKLGNRDSIVRSAGKPTAASISSLLAIILICAAVLRALFGLLMQ
ncbi:MAG: serine/threonine protein kinase [Alphaproteobacteria bacterium]|nr:serine/threonine protein kinase [Alphaproteobacteria bacterium]